MSQVWSHDRRTNFENGSFVDAFPFQRHHVQIPSSNKREYQYQGYWFYETRRTRKFASEFLSWGVNFNDFSFIPFRNKFHTQIISHQQKNALKNLLTFDLTSPGWVLDAALHESRVQTGPTSQRACQVGERIREMLPVEWPPGDLEALLTAGNYSDRWEVISDCRW